MDSCKNEIVVWKENYFMRTVNIYEPRGPKYNCTECNEIFNTKLSILTHSKMHLKPFCVVCGIYTLNAQEMQNHMKQDHRSMVKIIPTKGPGLDEDMTVRCEIEKGKSNLKKKKVQQSKKAAFGFNVQKRNEKQSTKCVISRFGRCINVKLPDF